MKNPQIAVLIATLAFAAGVLASSLIEKPPIAQHCAQGTLATAFFPLPWDGADHE
jgi:hypothetical protein